MSSSQLDIGDISDNLSNLSISLKKENVSSYGGILSTLNDESDVSRSESKDSNYKNKKNKNFQPITFEWEKEEESTVYLTGSFCSWSQYIIIPKVNNIYSITLNLPKALHKFKYRINDIFMVSEKYPIMKEGECDCNYIDTSEQETTKKSNKSENEENEDSIKDSYDSLESSESNEYDFEDEETKISIKMKKKKEKLKKMKYSIKYPKKKNLNNYAPIVPYPYNYIYNINIISSQRLIGKAKYYEPQENNILGDNCSYKKIEVLPAVEINHLHSQNSNTSMKTILCSSFSRYRNKFITFLYYKPI